MNEFKVFIVEDNLQWAEMLADTISNQDEFDVVGVANDGADVLLRIEALKPDIIIMDIVLPFYDGIYLIQYIRSSYINYNPIIVIVSGLGSDIIIKIALELNISYFFHKPLNLEIFVDSLKKIAAERIETITVITPEAVISDVLQKLGVPMHLRSYEYIKDAIELCLKDEEYQHLITKILYPEIAKKRRTDAKQIERGIRYSINTAKKNNSDFYKQVMQSDSQNITNSSFIIRIVKYIKELLDMSN